MLELTERQSEYVALRSEGLKPYDACKQMGYTTPWQAAQRMEHDTRIRMVLAHSAKKALEKMVLTKQDVLEGMHDAVQSAATSTELVAAWREIGKLIGAYEPEKVSIEINDVTAEKLAYMSNTELARLADLHGFNIHDAEEAEFFEDEDFARIKESVSGHEKKSPDDAGREDAEEGRGPRGVEETPSAEKSSRSRGSKKPRRKAKARGPRAKREGLGSEGASHSNSG